MFSLKKKKKKNLDRFAWFFPKQVHKTRPNKTVRVFSPPTPPVESQK